MRAGPQQQSLPDPGLGLDRLSTLTFGDNRQEPGAQAFGLTLSTISFLGNGGSGQKTPEIAAYRLRSLFQPVLVRL